MPAVGWPGPAYIASHLREIVLERAEQDERDEAAEEEHHHEGVEDGEPVDLVLEELGVLVVLEPVLEGCFRLYPVHLRTTECLASDTEEREPQGDRATGRASLTIPVAAPPFARIIGAGSLSLSLVRLFLCLEHATLRPPCLEKRSSTPLLPAHLALFFPAHPPRRGPSVLYSPRR